MQVVSALKRAAAALAIVLFLGCCAAAYVAIGDRPLGLMAEVAKGRFAQMTDDELRALYGYLRSRALTGTMP